MQASKPPAAGASVQAVALSFVTFYTCYLFKPNPEVGLTCGDSAGLELCSRRPACPCTRQKHKQLDVGLRVAPPLSCSQVAVDKARLCRYVPISQTKKAMRGSCQVADKSSASAPVAVAALASGGPCPHFPRRHNLFPAEQLPSVIFTLTAPNI